EAPPGGTDVVGHGHAPFPAPAALLHPVGGGVLPARHHAGGPDREPPDRGHDHPPDLDLHDPLVALPLAPPIAPMLAKLERELPRGDGWIYEPKWDGFRAIVFVSGGEVFVQSRDTKALNRYFPELV